MKDLKFEKPNTSIVVLAEDNTYGKFEVTPLERGYGITLGNSMRRILLSSLPGAAVINIEIEGVDHEYSTIDGVVEDVTSIVLNLKDLVVAIDSDDPDVSKRLEIYIDGPQEVTAKVIICANEVKIINENQHIERLVFKLNKKKIEILEEAAY